MPLESDPFYDRGADAAYDEESKNNQFSYPRYSNLWADRDDPYVNVPILNADTGQFEGYRRHLGGFIYDEQHSVKKQGTGFTKDNQPISLASQRAPDGSFAFVYKEGGSCRWKGKEYEVKAWKTVAMNNKDFPCGTTIKIEKYGDTIFKMVDTGSGLIVDYNSDNIGQVDVFVGPMNWSTYYSQFPGGSDYSYSRVSIVEKGQ
jgi:3D (Asp-Asp-Asp) domain-containing protein